MTNEQNEKLVTTLGIQVAKKIRYLRINLTARCSSLKEDNYVKLFHQLKLDLQKWKNMQISLLGRIAAVKMVILPKLLFLFQNIPIQLNKSFFKELDEIISKFIWQNKKPRIKKLMLQEAKDRGGLGLPDWELYAQAAALVWIKDWMSLKDNRLLNLEGHGLQKGWHAYICYDKCPQKGYFRRHQIRGSLLTVWEKVKKKIYAHIPNWISTIEAQTHPNLLGQGKILTYKEILDEGGKLRTKQDLEERGNKIGWWPYMLITTQFNKDKKTFGIYRENQELDRAILEGEEKLISKIYKCLLDRKLESEIVKENMIVWMRNFGHSIELDDWAEIWERNIKLVTATAYKENIYKMFYRWHLPPARIAKMFPNLAPDCWKCKNTQGTYFHVWWTCPMAKTYWKKINNWIKDILGIKLDIRPEIYLLGIRVGVKEKSKLYLILHIITAARIVFAQHWKAEEIPKEETIIYKIMECAEMDRLTQTLKGKEDSRFFRSWNPWYNWLNKRIGE